ncbi:hypothetical protein PJL18_04205 [Paenarthrobacter nicotinovorans]|nr:hypothetical protein [Paenarthrobacter nicotinovorans]
MQAGGEAVLDLVLDGDGFFEGFSGHDTQHRAEELGQVEVGATLDARTDARGPQAAGLVEALGLDGPGFAVAQGGEGVQELAVGGLDDRPHLRGGVLRVANGQGARGVDQLVVEAGALRDRAHQDHQRSGRALLSGVAERRVHDILGCEVKIGARGDDDGVLAGGLGEQRQVLAEGAEQLSGFIATGEDHAVNARVRDQLGAQFTLFELHQRQNVTRHTGFPQGIHHDRTGPAGLLCRLDHDGGT